VKAIQKSSPVAKQMPKSQDVPAIDHLTVDCMDFTEDDHTSLEKWRLFRGIIEINPGNMYEYEYV